MAVTGAPIQKPGCYEAYKPNFSTCSKYKECGYTCVGDYCSKSTPCTCDCDECAVFHAGLHHDPKTGRCTDGSVQVAGVPATPPSPSPSQDPTENPTVTPTQSPTETPTVSPTDSPTTLPPTTDKPSFAPTKTPSHSPTAKPTQNPTAPPTAKPSFAPSHTPTQDPTTSSPTPAPVTSSPTTSSPTTLAPTEKPNPQCKAVKTKGHGKCPYGRPTAAWCYRSGKKMQKKIGGGGAKAKSWCNTQAAANCGCAWVETRKKYRPYGQTKKDKGNYGYCCYTSCCTNKGKPGPCSASQQMRKSAQCCTCNSEPY